VLRCWAIREGLGIFSVGTIARVIKDLKPPPTEDRPMPRKYEIAAPMVMWSEDGAAFRDGRRKRELLVVQDECARFKTNWHLAQSSARATEVERISGKLLNGTVHHWFSSMTAARSSMIQQSLVCLMSIRWWS
jgi:transposase InsO family protein